MRVIANRRDAALAAVFSRIIGHSLSRNSSFSGARIVVMSVVGIGFGLWCGASVAASGSGISNAIFGLTLMAAVILGMMVTSAIGWHSLKANIGQNPLVVKLAEVCRNDYVKAMVIIVCWLPFLFYLLLSALNQCIRVHLGWHPEIALRHKAHGKSDEKAAGAGEDVATPMKVCAPIESVRP